MSTGPVDPDVDLHWERSHPAPPPAHRDGPLLSAVATGGAAGASLRYAIGVWAPPPSHWNGTAFHGWPMVNLSINVLGCALIGVLMTVAIHRWPQRRLLRPLLGTGLLGGFTTFSAYAVDVQRLLTQNQALQAIGYLVATPLLAVAAVWLATLATLRALGSPQP